MTQRQIRVAVTDMCGQVCTSSLFHSSNDNHLNRDESVEELVNEGILDMNDILPEDSNGHPVYQQPQPRVDETGFHTVESPSQVRRLQNYQARRQEWWNEYHKKVMRE